MINLSERQETHEQWKKNKVINQIIRDTWNSSKEELQTDDNDIGTITMHRMLISKNYYKVPYGKKGESNLKKSGCAVFCFQQGLRIRGIECDMISLAKEVSKKGYYELGKGTYHNLFDHYGLRRATHVSEVFAALKQKHLVTMLVDYENHNDLEEGHFLNIVGKKRSKFIVDDPEEGRMEIPIIKIIEASEIAWIW